VEVAWCTPVNTVPSMWGGRGRDGGCFQSLSLGIRCRSNRASLHKWDCSELADNIHVYLEAFEVA